MILLCGFYGPRKRFGVLFYIDGSSVACMMYSQSIRGGVKLFFKEYERISYFGLIDIMRRCLADM